jgi:hypothetical protein
MPTIHDLLNGYNETIKARKNARKQAIVNNADIWFGDLLGELSPGTVSAKDNLITIPVNYQGKLGEIYMDINGSAGLRFLLESQGGQPISPVKSINLPFYTWGKDRFATPVDGEALAELLLSVVPE